VGDNLRLFKHYPQQTVQLDTAYADAAKPRLELERMLGARVHTVTVHYLDLVNDATPVDVRYQTTSKLPAGAGFLAADDAEQCDLVGSTR
jgi:hypothetical protein